MSHHHLDKAKMVLDTNWRGSFTIPTDKLYPFQWNWDSGFITLGLAHYRLDRAMAELETLFRGQWENGMLPHILFHDESQKTYFPNYDFWDSGVNPGSPKNLKTSGITQPPVHGFVLEHLLYHFGSEPGVRDFVKMMFPKVKALNKFFYTHRDPNREGLCFIYHPWETGRDNSPLWDKALNSIQIDPSAIPQYTRRDTSVAPAEERPTSHEYDRYVYLCLLGKRHQYEGPGIAEESPVLIQDTLMNAVLIKSNEGLITIGKTLGEDTSEIEEWQQQSIKMFRQKLWSEELQCFTGYDMRHEEHLPYREIGGYISLFAGLCDDQTAQVQREELMRLHNEGYYLCPSFDPGSALFDARRYWRGPIWPHMNWMIYHGMKDYGFDDIASILREDTLALIASQGYYEYFDARKSQNATRGHGGNNFSWTASTIIDLLQS